MRTRRSASLQPAERVQFIRRAAAMKLQRILWSALPALCFGCAALAQETVKLEYKLQPATELTYKLSGTVKMSLSGQVAVEMQGTFSGVVRFVIADVDAAGEMLIGQLNSIKIAMKTKLPQGEQNQDQTNDETAV